MYALEEQGFIAKIQWDNNMQYDASVILFIRCNLFSNRNFSIWIFFARYWVAVNWCLTDVE